MNSANLEAHLESESASLKKKRRWFIPLFLFLIAFIIILGPTLLVNLLLKKSLAPGTGFTLDYTSARAGFLFNSLAIENLSIQPLDKNSQLPSFKIKSLQLKGVSRKNLITLCLKPENLPQGPFYLAKSLQAYNINLSNTNGSQQFAGAEGLSNKNLSGEALNSQFHGVAMPFWGLESAEIKISELFLNFDKNDPLIPLLFQRLEAEKINFFESSPSLERNVSLSQFEARDLGVNLLGGMQLKLLNFSEKHLALSKQYDFNLNGLLAAGVKLEALKQALGSSNFPYWWLVSGCETLNLAQAVYELNGQEAFNIKSASYDFIFTDNGKSYLRTAQFEIDPAVLSGGRDNSFWAGLEEINQERIEGQLSLMLNYEEESGLTDIKSIKIDLANLGILEISAQLSGVPVAKAHYSHYQILFMANTWRLENIQVDFSNLGLAEKYQSYLDKTLFLRLPKTSSADNIMFHVIDPLRFELEEKGWLKNISAVYSEVEAFVREPSSIRLKSEPSPPFKLEDLDSSNILTLANIDNYDIIKRLNLSIEVGQRAAVYLAVDDKAQEKIDEIISQPFDQGLDLPFELK